jgi:DNA polymerase-1
VISVDDLKNLKYVKLGELPNLRNLIVPSKDHMIVDMDLDRADAQFVAWEARDVSLKDILKRGEDLHLQNARDIWGPQCTVDGPERQLAKRFCHAVNYGAYPKKLAAALGISIKTAEWIYHRWFNLHPGIREWHNRIKHQLNTERLVRNPFGFERYYFERPDQVVNQALAWGPQSATGIIINTAWDNIDNTLPEVEVLMQVHDSLTMQVPSQLYRELLPHIQEQSLVVVPYEDPLIVPVGFSVSSKSWGEVADPCKKGKDPELQQWLTQGLNNAKQKASRELVADVL